MLYQQAESLQVANFSLVSEFYETTLKYVCVQDCWAGTNGVL